MTNLHEETLQQLARSVWFTPLLGLVAALLFLPPVIRDLLLPVNGDSSFNLWFAQLYANNFQQGVLFPDVINVANNGSLNPLPAFYAPLLHFLAAVFIHSGLSQVNAYGVLLFLFSWLQYGFCAYTFGARSKLLGNLAAAVLLFSSYTLNNIFARGAFAEGLAGMLMVICVCALLGIYSHPERKRELLVVAVTMLAMLCNIHAVTFTYTFIFFWPLFAWIGWLYFFRHRKKGDVVFACVLGMVALFGSAHFVCSVLANPELFITTYKYGPHVGPLENLLLRFFPFPACLSVFATVDSPVGFGYFILQINMALVFWGGYLLWVQFKKRRDIPVNWAAFSLMALLYAAAILLGFFTIKTHLLDIMLRLVDIGQFAFRLIAYINLLLFCVIFAGVLTAARAHFSAIYKSGVWALLLSFVGLLAFYGQMGAMYEWRLANLTAKKFINVPDTTNGHHGIYGYYDYATPHAYAQEMSPEKARIIPLRHDTQFAKKLYSEPVNVTEGELLRFLVVPFRWNRLYMVDDAGKRVRLSRSATRATREPYPHFDMNTWGLYVTAPKTGTVVFEARFEPSNLWTVLRTLFPISMLLLGMAALCCSVRLLMKDGLRTTDDTV